MWFVSLIFDASYFIKMFLSVSVGCHFTFGYNCAFTIGWRLLHCSFFVPLSVGLDFCLYKYDDNLLHYKLGVKNIWGTEMIRILKIKFMSLTTNAHLVKLKSENAKKEHKKFSIIICKSPKLGKNVKEDYQKQVQTRNTIM